jgi:hypothetical protein
MRLKKFRVAVIGVLPVAAASLTMLEIYSFLAWHDVTAITGFRFLYNYLIRNDKMT